MGYLMGSLPSADIATRLATDGSVDLRTAGSGNPGAANAKDVLGAKWGAAVMTADIAKGAVACVAGRGLGGDLGAHVGGTAAVVGHCFPVWNGFRGGKGFASAVGQVATTFPAFLPAGIGVVGATVSVPWKSRSTAVTLAGAISWVVAAMLWWRKGWRNGFGPKPTVALPSRPRRRARSCCTGSRTRTSLRQWRRGESPLTQARFGRPALRAGTRVIVVPAR